MKDTKNILVDIPNLDSSLFTWLNWRAGSTASLGLACRRADLTSARGKRILREHAVGWCKAEKLPCRPKRNQIALMCFVDEDHFWFHLMKDEFFEIFSKQ